MAKFVDFKIGDQVGLTQVSNIIFILPMKGKDDETKWQVKLGDGYYYFNDADAKALVEMWRRGELKNCVVEGPHALDTAALKWCAELKGLKSEVAGDVDIMLMPTFESGNMVAKVFVFYMRRQIGHVIMGAKAPILINSRTDDAALKLNSIALSILTGI